jgi:hypothetical protein
VEDGFYRCGSSKFHDAVIFFVGGEDLKAMSDDKEDVGKKEFETFGNFFGQTEEDCFEPFMIFFAELFVLLDMLFLKVEQGFLLRADDTGTGFFKPEVNLGLEHAFDLFGSVGLKLARGLRDAGGRAEAFFIEAEGHGEIWAMRNIFIYCSQFDLVVLF